MAGRRGRPLGHRLSQESKDRIAASKTGYIHGKDAKRRISNSLIDYFKDHPSEKKIIICKGCGMEMEKTTAVARIYCDDCLKKFMYGEDIDKYNKVFHTINKSKEYKLWRLKVLIRDKFMCRVCGKVGEDVHHIISILKIKDMPELLYNSDIGLTLCKCCHGGVHTVIRRERAKIEKNKTEA